MTYHVKFKTTTVVYVAVEADYREAAIEAAKDAILAAYLTYSCSENVRIRAGRTRIRRNT